VNVLDQFAASWEGLDDPRTGNAALHKAHAGLGAGRGALSDERPDRDRKHSLSPETIHK